MRVNLHPCLLLHTVAVQFYRKRFGRRLRSQWQRIKSGGAEKGAILGVRAQESSPLGLDFKTTRNARGFMIDSCVGGF